MGQAATRGRAGGRTDERTARDRQANVTRNVQAIILMGVLWRGDSGNGDDAERWLHAGSGALVRGVVGVT